MRSRPFRPPSRRSSACPTFRPRCEELEPRCLLSQTLLSADGFAQGDYPAGGRLLNAGPLKAGFDGPWTGYGTGSFLAGSLAYPGYGAAGGNRVELSGGVNLGRGLLTGNNGPLGNYIDPSGHVSLSRSGEPLYLAFLMQVNGTALNSAFGLFRDGATTAERQFHIGITSGNTFQAIVDPTGETVSLGRGDNAVHLFVVRIDFATNADIISVWRDPALGGAEPAPDAQFTDFVLSFNRLGLTRFNGTGTVDYDELRLGSTWAGVTSPDSLPLVQGTQAIGGLVGLPPGGSGGQYGYDFFPFVDAFGQYRYAEWATKAHSLDELVQQGIDEANDLANNPGPSDWDIFGGWAAGPQLAATGYFRVQKYQGKWWFVDPMGYLFFSNGMDNVNNGGGETGVSGRENYFADLPQPGLPTSQFLYQVSAPVTGGGYYNGQRPVVMNFPDANRLQKYGTNYAIYSLYLAQLRLRSWGMNTIGAWTAENVLQMDLAPYTKVISPSAPNISANFPDYFNPAYATNLRNLLRAETGRTLGDPWNIGYFVNNELTWTQTRVAETQLGIDTLHAPATQAAKLAFRGQLEATYGTIAALNAQWGTTYASWDAVLTRTNVTPAIARAGADLTAFYRNYADQYFSTTRAILREVAPDQLYLGCKFTTNAQADARRAAAQYADVVSIDEYTSTVTVPAGLEADVPILSAEFYFSSTDSGLFRSPGSRMAANQADRGVKYAAYLASALANPRYVGAHWFEYADWPTTGVLGGGNADRNTNLGFLSVTDTPYGPLVDAARAEGYALYQTRFGPAPDEGGGAAAFAVFGPSPVPAPAPTLPDAPSLPAERRADAGAVVGPVAGPLDVRPPGSVRRVKVSPSLDGWDGEGVRLLLPDDSETLF